MKALTLRLIVDEKNEERVFGFFNETLSPLLDHVECDVYVINVEDATQEEISERNGDNA